MALFGDGALAKVISTDIIGVAFPNMTDALTQEKLRHMDTPTHGTDAMGRLELFYHEPRAFQKVEERPRVDPSLEPSKEVWPNHNGSDFQSFEV